MAEHRVAAGDVAVHGLVVGQEVETVRFDQNIAGVEIISDGRAAVYYTVNRGEPSVGGANCFVLPQGVMSVDERPAFNDPATSSDVVRLVSDGEATVSIQALR